MHAIALHAIACILEIEGMFKTHESAHHDLQAAFGPGHHHWSLIEREIATPWLHATMLVIEDDVEYASAVMPSDLQTFLSIANAKDFGARITELQLMSPPWMNNAGRWQLAPIRKIEIAESPDKEVVHIYSMEEGDTYYDPSQKLNEVLELTNQRTVYYANLS